MTKNKNEGQTNKKSEKLYCWQRGRALNWKYLRHFSLCPSKTSIRNHCKLLPSSSLQTHIDRKVIHPPCVGWIWRLQVIWWWSKRNKFNLHNDQATWYNIPKDKHWVINKLDKEECFRVFAEVSWHILVQSRNTQVHATADAPHTHTFSSKGLMTKTLKRGTQ